MMIRNRNGALAVAIVALWAAVEARAERNDALWQLPEGERYYLLLLAGTSSLDVRRSQHYRSSSGRYLSWNVCLRYVGPEPRDDPEMRKDCLGEFPPMLLERIHEYGYDDVKLEDVADLETFSFFAEVEERIRNKTPEEKKEFWRGYHTWKNNLGL